jgi:N-ethylmaleimide reductase
VVRPLISNPDLVERFARSLPLNPPAEMLTWYSFGAEGYTNFLTDQEFPAVS